MSNVVNIGKAKDAIRVLGGSNKNIPQAPTSIQNLFSVVAEMYLTVPFEHFESVVCLLKQKRYVYKVKSLTRHNVIALQYQMPE